MEGNSAVDSVSLKVYVDKRSNRVIYAESDGDFVNLLFSFLTIPVGVLVTLARKQKSPMAEEIGSIFNLYRSVEDMDERDFHNQACKDMLLNTRHLTERFADSLKLKPYDALPPRDYFQCSSCYELSFYAGFICLCGKLITQKVKLHWEGLKNPGGSCSFVKRTTRFMICDDLRVKLLSSSEIFSLFSELGIPNRTGADERTINIGVDEVLSFVVRSFLSKSPLTEALDINSNKPKPRYESISSIYSFLKPEETVKSSKTIPVKLTVCKSNKRVCYAEASKGFVNLLFSILTIPLSHVANRIRDNKGCVDNLYKSVLDLDTEIFSSNQHKNLLLSPLPPVARFYTSEFFGIQNPLFHPYLYCRFSTRLRFEVIADQLSSSTKFILTLDPLPKDDLGFLNGALRFIVTDDLRVTSISSDVCFSILDELKVPFGDIEEKVVNIDQEEAMRLLVSSFVSESALTDALIRDEEPSAEAEPHQL